MKNKLRDSLSVRVRAEGSQPLRSVFSRSFAPHPGPLPKGEGDRRAAGRFSPILVLAFLATVFFAGSARAQSGQISDPGRQQ